MAKETYLYHTIAEAVRHDILEGRLQRGDQLPPVRKMTERWGCAPGTVQRAYQELARQGLVVSRHGRGTQVTGEPAPAAEEPLRRAGLVHRAEAFLLEALTAGFDLEGVEQAFRLALDRWRAAPTRPEPTPRRIVRFVGSHDLALDRLASHFDELAKGYRMEARFVGSLGGLIALAEGQAELAGCHLWDQETATYNAPFVRRLFPGRKVALLTLVERRLGLILPAGNPLGLRTLSDLARDGVRFANRQPGSGTRVWLDAQLQQLGVDPEQIEGYDRGETTHSGVARLIAEGSADAGLGLEAAAAAFGLDFVFLTAEPYQLAVPAAAIERAPLRELASWLQTDAAKAALGGLRGYDTRSAGTLTWVN
ncbi:MAG TPA: substrate-binding domain-containing protein [Anaerolineales bacterium]|nr:substrate-binding domain-containing protein [Anaerolineales bacterium]